MNLRARHYVVQDGPVKLAFFADPDKNPLYLPQPQDWRSDIEASPPAPPTCRHERGKTLATRYSGDQLTVIGEALKPTVERVREGLQEEGARAQWEWPAEGHLSWWGRVES